MLLRVWFFDMFPLEGIRMVRGSLGKRLGVKALRVRAPCLPLLDYVTALSATYELGIVVLQSSAVTVWALIVLGQPQSQFPLDVFCETLV